MQAHLVVMIVFVYRAKSFKFDVWLMGDLRAHVWSHVVYATCVTACNLFL